MSVQVIVSGRGVLRLQKSTLYALASQPGHPMKVTLACPREPPEDLVRLFCSRLVVDHVQREEVLSPGEFVSFPSPFLFLREGVMPERGFLEDLLAHATGGNVVCANTYGLGRSIWERLDDYGSGSTARDHDRSSSRPLETRECALGPWYCALVTGDPRAEKVFARCRCLYPVEDVP